LTWQRHFDANWYGVTLYNRFGNVVLSQWYDAKRGLQYHDMQRVSGQ